MRFKTTSSPHLQEQASVHNVMQQVLLALVPGILASLWLFGWGVLTNIVLGIVFALGFEALSLQLRRRPLKPFLSDYSAVVTALLLALALPPMSEWWLILVGMFFAIVIAKHLYGGLGYNPFNPAMVGYVVLIISFPTAMTLWASPSELTSYHLGLGEVLHRVFGGVLPNGVSWDAVTQATPLDTTKTQLGLDLTLSEIQQSPVFGTLGGRGWESLGLAFALGGGWLIYKRIIDWRIPLAMLLGLAVPALLFYFYNSDQFASPLFHLFSGGALLGAFFIVTDPVSGCSSRRGKVIFAAGVGLLVYIIRTWGNYPDGVAFAVLLMNMAAPMLDYYTVPPVFGEKKEDL